MTETFLALLLAHLIAAFVLPERPGFAGLALRVGGFAVAAAVTLGLAPWQLILAAAGAHAALHAAATALPRSLGAFFAAQALHLASLLALTAWIPSAYALGLWGSMDWAEAYTFACGALIAILAGGPAIGLLMTRFTAALPEGLTGAGRLIGGLERTLIFALVMVGEPAGIGFLIAAKSILRFDAAKTPHASEYVIVGTLASFGWALIASLLTLEALEIVRTAP
ncbi:MAG: hypothetical protein AAGM84_03595 [Pseudomonadota bacterium]